MTGESAPVIRESGGDRSSVTGGTRVLSDRIVIRVTADPGETFLDRMILLVEGAIRQRTPERDRALDPARRPLDRVRGRLRRAAADGALREHRRHARRARRAVRGADPDDDRRAALGDRHRRHEPARAEERAGHLGPRGRGRRRRLGAAARQDRHDHARQPPGDALRAASATCSEDELAEAAQLSSLADETPEGRSIVVLAKERYDLRGRELAGLDARFIAFTAETRMSGVDIDGTGAAQGRRRRRAPRRRARAAARCRATSPRRSTRSRAPARRRSWCPRARACSA